MDVGLPEPGDLTKCGADPVQLLPDYGTCTLQRFKILDLVTGFIRYSEAETPPVLDRRVHHHGKCPEDAVKRTRKRIQDEEDEKGS